jgi:hypothetical protein
MAEHIQYEDKELFNPETQHEHTDVPIRPLFWFIAFFIAFAVVSHVVLFLFYKGLAKAERNRMEAPQTQVARPADANVPKNQPLLQPFPRDGVVPYRQTPVTDLEAMRRAEKAVLENYGWIDKQQGVVHIPIEEAKKMFAARAAVAGQTGVPVTQAPSVAPQTGTSASPASPDSQPATMAPAVAQPSAGGTQ